jgi:HD superfamily phosphohydrolase
MGEIMEIRDPIHGFIELSGQNDQEEKIVNHPAFQRLCRVKQLALAALVYPGAVHTRFDHSLGVFHIAAQLAANPEVGLSDEEKKHVRLAALLHDIGHGPFSHVSEIPLARLSRDVAEAAGIEPNMRRMNRKETLLTGS